MVRIHKWVLSQGFSQAYQVANYIMGRHTEISLVVQLCKHR